jgi:hypothetical protein
MFHSNFILTAYYAVLSIILFQASDIYELRRKHNDLEEYFNNYVAAEAEFWKKFIDIIKRSNDGINDK